MHVVKYKSVSVNVYPWRHPSGREYWRFKQGGKDVTRSTLEKAKRDAKKHAQTIYRGSLDLNILEADEIRKLQRIVEAGALQHVEEFLLWHSRKAPKKLAIDAYTEFLALKEKNAGRSTQNVRTIRKHVKPFIDIHGKSDLASITVKDIEDYMESNPKNKNRTRRNIRASLVTFFRWCRLREYLPDERTAAEKAEIPMVTDTVPETYTPDELRVLLANVRPDFRAWLAGAALAGIRTDEICPIAGSRKPPLDWSDIDFERDQIVVSPATAKMKRRRVIPMCAALKAILLPLRKPQGPMHATIAPTRSDGKKIVAETARLGAFIGGWKDNALRASFISFRCALKGMGVTAMEAGNSEDEIKKSYLDAKSPAEAEAWFSVSAFSPITEHLPNTAKKP
jgi:integrase